VKAAYAHALASGYRFYSYGDACLLFPSQQQKG
jgi:S-adenosylmethionine:tRNA ribosyltransferase-isomerase